MRGLVRLLECWFLKRRTFLTYDATHLQPGGIPRPCDYFKHHRARWFWSHKERLEGVTPLKG